MQRLLLLLPVALCSTGCMSWWMGTVPPESLGPELRAQAPKHLKPLQLAALGVPVQAEYRIQPGDLLDVTVSDLLSENVSFPVPARVQEDGTVLLPLVGRVGVSTLTVPESERVVFAAYSSKEMLKKPQVLVSLREVEKIKVNVLGAVHKPGQFELRRSESDLLSALVAAGGLTDEAETKIEIHRRVLTGSTPTSGNGERPGCLPVGHEVSPGKEPGSFGPMPARELGSAGTPPAQADKPEATGPGVGSSLPRVIRLDLANEKDKQMLAQGVSLQNGDTVTIEEKSVRPVYVVGMVNKAGEYKLPTDRNMYVLEAIGLAGGVDRTSLPDKAIIIRQRPDESGLVAIRISLERAKKDMAENIPLMPGDTLSVEETPMSYLRGLIRGAFRLGVGTSIGPGGFY
jgi:polysaccharide export outer membrane protein